MHTQCVLAPAVGEIGSLGGWIRWYEVPRERRIF